ncbi:MAG: ABC transporter ATP-binding protein [Flavobacteriales bacterium]|nr:ABC transporter ATP-binding protein [Flavobacteriales bacterium]
MDSVVLNKVGKRYGKLWALRNVDAAFASGEVIMVIGPNGSGKTTMIKCILGLVRATEGSIEVHGMDVNNDPKYRHAIGYMPQLSEFPRELTVEHLLNMMNDIRNAAPGSTDDRLISALGVDGLLNKRVSTLSGGMRQKVSAVLAFRYKPSVLILDEPTAGLDPISAGTLLEAVMETKSNGAMVMITSHIMEEVQQLGDRMAYLQDGTLRAFLAPETVMDVTGEKLLSKALPKYLAKLPKNHVESL